MAKFQSPLLGYNNNVRHKGRVFHIQTEDSGVNHPHIITHLFMDGGRILKSVKRSYAEHVGADGMSETVRGLMKDQHKAMFIALRDGQFDGLVDGATAVPPAKPAVASAKLEVAAPAETRAPEAGAEPTSAVIAVLAAAAPDAKTVVPGSAGAPSATLPVAGAKPAAEAKPEPELAGPSFVPATRPDPQPPASEVPATIDESRFDALGTPNTSLKPATVQLAPPAPVPASIPAVSVQPTTARSASGSASPTHAGERAHPHSAAATLAATVTPGSGGPSVKRPSGGLLIVPEDDVDEHPKTTREPAPPVPSFPAGIPSGVTSGVAARGRSSQDLTVDFDALEHGSSRDVSLFNSNDLPPPPRNLFAKEPGTGTYRSVDSESRRPPSRPPERPSRQPSTKPLPPGVGRPSGRPGTEGRYAPARPAAIFGTAAKQTSSSIFSDDLVTDKSLDEVILSYLAEDLEPPRRK